MVVLNLFSNCHLPQQGRRIKKEKKFGQARWFMPVIPANWEDLGSRPHQAKS
jgi:hypothetical protein